MTYIDIDYYIGLYGEIARNDFNRLVWDACHTVDGLTTGVDGVVKLKVAFPTNSDSVEAVKRCVAKVLNLMATIEKAEATANDGDTGVTAKRVQSISAGGESITYASATTMVDAVLSDKNARKALFYETVRDYLSGVTDANGVNLLYMGVYPRRVTNV